MSDERTTCAVVGGGPAGMVLGLLMARAGVSVTVLEKHADFLRDFRGDTVHTSTMTLLDELGLWDRFATLPWKPIHQARVTFDDGTWTIGNFDRVRAPHPFVAMVPQWHLLDMLAGAAEAEPSFTLIRNAEVTDLVHDATGRVTGVRWVEHAGETRAGETRAGQTSASQDGAGAENVLHADVVVACDGRDSRVRAASGLAVHRYEVPMDVWWFRLPRGEGDDPDGGLGRVDRGRLMVMLDRGDHFQVAYMIPRGADAGYRARPISTLRADLLQLAPWLGDRVEALVSWDDVKLLEVELDRLHTWSAPGVLCIGDAAHAMSPIGGIGINLAVQDAVATARTLAPALANPHPAPAAVDDAFRRVQRRRTVPTVLTQGFQRLAHRGVIRATLGETPSAEPLTAPWVLRQLSRFPALQAIPARAIGIGVLPEHAPSWARRAPRPAATPSGRAG